MAQAIHLVKQRLPQFLCFVQSKTKRTVPFRNHDLDSWHPWTAGIRRLFMDRHIDFDGSFLTIDAFDLQQAIIRLAYIRAWLKHDATDDIAVFEPELLDLRLADVDVSVTRLPRRVA